MRRLKSGITSSMVAVLAVLIVVIGMMGCTSEPATYEGAMSGQQATAPAAREMEAKQDIAARASLDASGNLGSGGAAPAQTTLQPELIKTANVSLKVDDIYKATKKLSSLAHAMGGLVTNQSYSLGEGGNTYRSGSLTVRIPQDKLDPFLDALESSGEMLNKQITATDVGMEMVDITARVRNLQAEEKALQAIMQRTGKIPEVLEVSRELARVRGEIEQSKSRLEYLRQNVAYSSVNIAISEKMVTSPTNTQPGIGTVIGNSLKQSVGALQGFLLGFIALLIRFVVFLLPVFLILGGLVYLVVRLIRALFGNIWKAKRYPATGLQNKTSSREASNQDDPPSD